MRFGLLIIASFLIFISFKPAEVAELTVDYVVKDQLSDFEVNGEVDQLIERRYSVNDTVRKLTNEFHINYNELGQVKQYTMYRMTHYSDRSVMEKSARLNYFYEADKLVMIESFSYRDPEVEPDSSERSYIKYTYHNAKKASYKAYRYGNYDHNGEIKIIDNQHVSERIKYPKGKSKPVSYVKEYDANFQLIKFERNYIYEKEKKVETKIYKYQNGRLAHEESHNLKQNYDYELDSNGNWTLRRTFLSNNNLIEELEREVIYR